MDPLTVTALALESVRNGRANEHAVMVSCDCVGISGYLRNAVAARLRESLPELDSRSVCLNATHTHTAPENGGVNLDTPDSLGCLPIGLGLTAPELGAMGTDEYVAYAAARIAEAVTEAWRSRQPGRIGFGLGQAVVGRNRRIAYYGGESRMYGKTNDPEFSHVEGGEDHSVNLLCTWTNKRELTGLVVNLACPSQVSESLFQVSADYWHDTRAELRRRFGDRLQVLAQCSAAGDQSPHVQVGQAGEERMLRLAGRTPRQQIAVRIADAVAAILPFVEQETDWNPVFAHRMETLELPLRKLNERDVSDANAEAEQRRSRYEELRRDLVAHPEKRQQPRWYTEITASYRGMLWYQDVEGRFRDQQTRPTVPVEIHVLRLGDAVFATNPFECYLDFGTQIKARSPATQTFVVQLAGSGSYLPTARATAGRSYGAIPASTPVGPEGGHELVERTLATIAALWGQG
jgi:hypothetical protein